MKDKLKQLHEPLLIDDHDDGDTDDDGLLQPTAEMDNNAFMKEFFSNVDEIKQAINVIGQSVRRIKHNNTSMLETLSHEVQKRENEELCQQIKQQSRKVHSGLKRINQQLKAEESGPDRGSVNHRIKMVHHVNLTHMFHEAMMEYSHVQEDYRDKTKVMIQQQLQITTGRQVTENDVDEMIEKGNLQVFTQDILVSTSQQRQALTDVEQRHQEIMALEQDIRELQEMFIDISALVQEQLNSARIWIDFVGMKSYAVHERTGEVINRIEYNVESAAHHVKRGRLQVNDACQLKKSYNRKRYILICICIVILLVIVLIIAIPVGVHEAKK